MVEFRIDTDRRKYFARWSGEDPFPKLFLRIRPVTPVVRIAGGRVELDRRGADNTKYIPLNRTKNWNFIDLPKLGNARYCFELFADESCGGEPISRQTVLLGNREKPEVRLSAGACTAGFVKVTVFCRYQIPAELFGLAYKGIHTEGYFSLPPMQEAESGFSSSCFLKKNAYQRLTIRFDSSISDFFSVKKT